MTGSSERPLRRVLLGVGAGEDIRQSVAAAATLGSRRNNDAPDEERTKR